MTEAERALLLHVAAQSGLSLLGHKLFDAVKQEDTTRCLDRLALYEFVHSKYPEWRPVTERNWFSQFCDCKRCFELKAHNVAINQDMAFL